MTLSEVKGGRAFDIIPELQDILKPILDDPEAAKMLDARELLKLVPKGSTWKAFWPTYFGEWLRQAQKKVLAPHKDTLLEYGAALRGITKDEFAKKMTMDDILMDTIGIFTDEYSRSIFFYPSPI